MTQKSETPSTYTPIYWLIQDKKIVPELLLDFLELYWPPFIRKNGYIFLEKVFNIEEYNQLISENSNPEYWINLLALDEFFSELSDFKEKTLIFANALAPIWAAKLKRDFPSIKGCVE